MKKSFIILLLLVKVSAFAQPYNNEWIDYNKTYYKFKVGANGLYRISQSVLSSIGLGSTDVSQFQLWRNGLEVAIFTSAPSGLLGSSGYIEFWGEMNDGKPDLPLYRIADYQISDKWSLYTDTASYFLTVNAAGNNKRLVPVTNSIPAGVTPEPYFMHTVGNYYRDQIHFGNPQGSGGDALYSSSYEFGEGWASNPIGNNQTLTYAENNLFAYTGAGAPDAQIKMNVVGDAFNTRNAKLSLNGNAVFDNQFTAYNYLKLNGTIAANALNSNTASFIVTNSTTASQVDRLKVAFIELTYPRAFNFGGVSNFRFQLPAKAAGTYLEIAGFNFSGTPVLYDLNNGRRYEVTVSGVSQLRVFLQPTTTVQDFILVNEDASNIKNITSLEPRSFVNYQQSQLQGDYLIITNNALMNGSSGSKPVAEYQAYRASVAGGSFNAKVYLADQLIDQFSFGIKGHTLGVRNFTRWARNKFSSPVKHVFIIGKGVSYYWARMNESSPETDRLNLIPTFGYPASDKLLTAEGSSSQPLTSIGRISVINGDEVLIYLNKVKQYEQLYTAANGIISDNIWKKNVIHMVGANDQPTIDLLYGYLNQHKKIIEDTLYGANVFDFIKSASGSNQQSSAERLTAIINGGIGLLTYFGHSSTVGLAFNLETPENYNNLGKYPVFNMMGCNVGNIYGYDAGRLSAIQTISEKYLLAKDRGSIAMMAGTSLGYVSPLEDYNKRFYTHLARENYGLSIGELMVNTVKSVFQASTENALLTRSQCETYSLHGDPAIKLYQQPKPDYAIEDQMVTLMPAIISVAEPHFTIKAKIANLGKAVNQKLVVELKRTYPDLSTKIIRRDTIEGVRYMDSLSYQLNIDPVADKGANKITITIDPKNKIEELFENNNTVTKDVFIIEDDIKPVFPYDYAIVNRQGITLAASTGNPFAVSRNYIMELDTTRLFNSPLKVSQTKTSAGGVIEFVPGITFKDSTVYYWRVAAAAASSSEQPVWNYASFIYMSGNETGFSQSHYYQFDESEFNGIHIDSYTRTFLYDSSKVTIAINNSILPFSAGPAEDVAALVSGVGLQGGYIASSHGGASLSPQENSLRFYLINNKSLSALENQDLGSSGLYGSYRPIPFGAIIPRLVNFFQFDISTIQARRTVMQFLDSIPSNYIVGLTSNQIGSTLLPSEWQADTLVFGKNVSLYHKLKEIGLSDIDLIKSVVPYVFIYQKGNPQPLAQVVANDISEKLKVVITVPVSLTTGKTVSPIFSSAITWSKLIWSGYSLESPSTDKAFVSVMGIDKNGVETILIKEISVDQETLDLSAINAITYPSLRISIQSTDTENRSPYQLKRLQIYGTTAPEGAIAPNLYFSAKDTLDAGEPLNLGIAFKNVSNNNFDSLKIKLSVRNKNNVETIIPVPNQKALLTGDTIRLNVPINTRQFGGNNTLNLEFNPPGSQPEQYHFNNFIFKNFYVRSDTTNPYLDVTFDGVHILNKDIVSSKPDVLIKVTDDAKWLLLNNSDLVKVQLKYPDGLVKDYHFNNDTLVFAPATQTAGNKNTATINFKPYLSADGNYELIVAAKDQSGNQAGDLQYRVAFQVINKPMISNLLNYPNPFTTSTAFVFTLTGSEVPQNIRIQILTITGKIVKEITKAELGPIKIGRNITEYKWDGTDQFGQKLANGVYLYRVLTNLNGKSLEKYKAENDNTDRFFNKGYGKMYLMR